MQSSPLVALALTFIGGAAFWKFLDGILARRAAWDGKRLDEFGEIRTELRQRIRELEADVDRYRNEAAENKDQYLSARGAEADTKRQLASAVAQLELLRAKVQIKIDKEEADREAGIE